MENSNSKKNNNGEVEMRITLKEVLKEEKDTNYNLAKNKLGQQPNSLTPWSKPGFDPHMSSVVRLAKIYKRDVNDFFKAEGYQSEVERLAARVGLTKDEFYAEFEKFVLANKKDKQ